MRQGWRMMGQKNEEHTCTGAFHTRVHGIRWSAIIRGMVWLSQFTMHSRLSDRRESIRQADGHSISCLPMFGYSVSSWRAHEVSRKFDFRIFFSISLLFDGYAAVNSIWYRNCELHIISAIMTEFSVSVCIFVFFQSLTQLSIVVIWSRCMPCSAGQNKQGEGSVDH